MDARVAELSRSVDPERLGQRLRAARVAAGLTQSALADGEISAAYVSRIEAGQRRPDVTVLARLSARLDVDLVTLLEEPVDGSADEARVKLDHAELALASGDAQTARDAAAELLDDAEARRSGLVRRARHVLALSLESLGQVDDAIGHLEAIASAPVADVAWIKAVTALSRCLRERGDLTRAIGVGEEAAELIDDLGLAGTTESIQLSVTIAGAYTERGDLAYAMQICQRCAEEAERVGSPVAMGSAHWNASVVESVRGRHKSALALAQKALSVFESGEDARNLGRLRMQIAFMHLLQDPPDAASAKHDLGHVARELVWTTVSQVDRARFELWSGRADLLLGDLDTAAEHAAAAHELAESGSPLLTARALALSGRVQARRGAHEAARALYLRAVTIISVIGVDREVARLWFELGSLLEDSGDAAASLDAYRRGAMASGLVDPHRVAVRAESD